MLFFPHKSSRSAFTLIELLIVIAIIGLLAAILFPVFARARDNARRSVCQSNLKQMGLAIQQYNQDYDGIILPDYLTNFTDPKGLSWPVALDAYTKSYQVYVCPSAGTGMDWGASAMADACWGTDGSNSNGSFSKPGATSGSLVQAPPRVCYGINDNIHGVPTALGRPVINEAALTSPSTTASIFDEVWIDSPGNSYTTLYRLARAGYPRHSSGVNFLFADGHVKWIPGPKVLNGEVKFTP